MTGSAPYALQGGLPVNPLLQHRDAHLYLNAVAAPTQTALLHQRIEQLTIDVYVNRSALSALTSEWYAYSKALAGRTEPRGT